MGANPGGGVWASWTRKCVLLKRQVQSRDALIDALKAYSAKLESRVLELEAALAADRGRD